jgi:putative SOS response-associated peptidase YedK
MYIHMKNRSPFAFAGLWDNWHSKDGSEIRSCTIITTQPNELVEQIHNRMPVILPQSGYEAWLKEGENDPDLLQSLLRPYPSEEMAAFPVSKQVNSPQNDTPEVILPIK